MFRCAFGLSLLMFLFASIAHGEPVPDENASVDAKRQWVRAQMIREFADKLDASLLKEIDGKVNQMTPGRIEQLYKIYAKRQQVVQEARQQDQRLQQLEDAAYRQALIQQYQARLAAARSGRPAGFAPVITTLPSGTSLAASAVVSPDRRYVRINATPFFSSVGPVNTFTFAHPTHPQQQQVPLRPQERQRPPFRGSPR